MLFNQVLESLVLTQQSTGYTIFLASAGPNAVSMHQTNNRSKIPFQEHEPEVELQVRRLSGDAHTSGEPLEKAHYTHLQPQRAISFRDSNLFF